MNPEISTPDRLTQRLYTLDIDGVVAVYRDAVEVHLPASKHEYNPNGKPGRAAASEIVKSAKGFAETKETQIGLIIDVITRCITDFDRAVKAGLRKQVLSSDSHVWPFCNPEYPILETIARYWSNAIEILAKVDRKEAEARAATEGRERFAREAEVARQADKMRDSESTTRKEPGVAERNRIDAWALNNQAKWLELDKAARRLARWKFGSHLDTNALIDQQKGFVYCFYLVELENAIFDNKPIKTPEQVKSQLSDMSIPVETHAKQAVQATGVETNQTEQAVA